MERPQSSSGKTRSNAPRPSEGKRINDDPNYVQALLESIHDGIVTIDERGVINSVNPAAERIFGYKAGEVIGRNVSQLMPAPYRSEHNRHLQAARSEPERAVVGFCREVEGLRKDGSRFPLEISISEIGVEGRRLFTGIVRDLSERRKTEQALEESERRYRHLVETMNEGLAVQDERGIVTYVNPRLCEMLGYPSEHFVGRASMEIAKDLLDKESVPLVAEQSEIRRLGKRGRYELSMSRRDGQRMHLLVSSAPLLDSSGRYRGGLAVLTDVTEQRQARQVLRRAHDELEAEVEQRTGQLRAANVRLQREIAERNRSERALRESRQRLQDILDSMFVFVGLFSTDGVVIEANRAPLEAAGLRREEVIGRPFYETFWWSYSSAVQAQLRDALSRAAAGETVRYDVPIRVAGGRLITIDVAFAPLRDASGTVVQIVGTGVDITQRKQAEESNRRHQDELAHVSRLNVMGEMASHLAHELNQPLGAVGILVEAAIRQLSSVPETSGPRHPAFEKTLRTLHKVVGQVHRAGKIVARLRDFTRRKAPRRSSADVNRLIDEVCDFLAAEARQQSIEFRCVLADSLPELLVDSIQIEQVLLNLMRNGIDAINEASAVPRRLIICTSRRSSSEIEVSVSNPGRPLPEKSLDRLFEAFFTTKPDGMGVGLSISRTIIEMHGGRIWVTPEAEGGLTVHFTLPVNDIGNNLNR